MLSTPYLLVPLVCEYPSPAPHYMSSALADRLATACANDDIPSAEAAVADGASVNEKGCVPDWNGTDLPLASAVKLKNHDVVVWLLARGADPSGDGVIYRAACWSTVGILQLLVDAGGDVNWSSGSEPPLYCTVLNDRRDKARVLLDQPSLDVTTTYRDKPFERHARDWRRAALADMIAHEVGEWLLAPSSCLNG